MTPTTTEFRALVDALYPSQAALAREIGMTTTNLNKIYTGAVEPRELILQYLRLKRDHAAALSRLEAADRLAAAWTELVAPPCDR